MAVGLIRKSECPPACDRRAVASARAGDAERDADWPRLLSDPLADTDNDRDVVDYWVQRGALPDLALWG